MSSEIYKVEGLYKAISNAKLKPNSAVAIIYADSGDLLLESVEHYLDLRFDHVFLLSTSPNSTMDRSQVSVIATEPLKELQIIKLINENLRFLNGMWLYYGYSQEFFLYPFSEHRQVHDLIEFLVSERRKNLFTIKLDLYTQNILSDSNTWLSDTIFFDKIGYYSRPWTFPSIALSEDEQLRAVDVYGGLRWRISNFIPEITQSLSRVPFFFVDESLNFDKNGHTDREEFYTISSPHHRSPTGVVASFRLAQYINQNPALSTRLSNLTWSQSKTMKMTSPQLLSLGMMETGQWF